MKKDEKIGMVAPFPKLEDQDGEIFTKEGSKGKRILLSFHPLAWTGICADQMRSLEDNYDSLSELNTIPVGISVDTVPSKKAWAEELDIIKTRLLSDFWPHGEYAKEMGIFRESEGTSERANIILDEDGRVIFSRVYDISKLPDINEILEFLSR